MNADLLAMLGGAGLPGPNSSRRDEEGKTLISFKTGKMDPVLQLNGKYLVTADPRRGELSLVFTLPSTLKLEWKDRRSRVVVDSFIIIPEDKCTLTPVPTGREGDRVNLLQFGSNPDRRFFYWMQDKVEDDLDKRNRKEMNSFLSDTNKCIIAAGGEPPEDDPASLEESPSAGNTTTATTTSSNNNISTPPTNEQQQVDALSNILGNLGMPQPSSTSTSTTTPAPTTTPSANTATGGGVLTLADLQGAMAGLATHSPIIHGTTTQPSFLHQRPTPPLNELATSEAIDESGILDDEAAVSRLMELLPEGQRTEEMLRENLRSPQVQQALSSLTSALVGGGGDSGESYHSIIANFQLDAADGAAAMHSGNPIQAFLDCLIASVEKDKKKDEEEKQDEQMNE